MRALILAAGLGTRMQMLTRTQPKPLLKVGEKYLIEYSIESLVSAGIHDIVINIAYFGEQIKKAIGDGKKYDAHIIYSEEKNRLETGGGICHALPLLGEDPFLVISSDIISHFPLHKLPKQPQELAHLVLIDNPHFKPYGDFGLHQGYADFKAQPTFTFANIGIYRPELFLGLEVSHFPLSQVLFPAIHRRKVTAEHYRGLWFNIGTPQDLQQVNLLEDLSILIPT